MDKVIKNMSNITSNYTISGEVKEYSTKSNESKTENLSVAFTKDRSSMYEYGYSKDEILQSILLSNDSMSEISNIRLKETINGPASFKQGSVTIDEEPYENLDIMNGLTLPNSMKANSLLLVSYVLVIDENPDGSSVKVKTNVTFDANEVKNMSEFTPEVEIAITDNKLTVDKTSNKSVVIAGDTLMYQHVITNIGKYKNQNIFFVDNLPASVTFVSGSVKVNNEQKPDFNPISGFSLDELDINGHHIITFDVTVEDVKEVWFSIFSQ